MKRTNIKRRQNRCGMVFLPMETAWVMSISIRTHVFLPVEIGDYCHPIPICAHNLDQELLWLPKLPKPSWITTRPTISNLRRMEIMILWRTLRLCCLPFRSRINCYSCSITVPRTSKWRPSSRGNRTISPLKCMIKMHSSRKFFHNTFPKSRSTNRLLDNSTATGSKTLLENRATFINTLFEANRDIASTLFVSTTGPAEYYE